MQKNYESYSAEQFLEDPFFIQWIKKPTPEASLFWKVWIQKNPANLEEMKAAEQQLRAMLSAKRIKPETGDTEEVWARIEKSLFSEPSKIRKMRKIWSAAAAILLLISGGIYFLQSHEHPKRELADFENKVPVNDAKPGGNKATLTLANGSVVILETAKSGAISQQGGSQVIKLDDGRLLYKAEVGNAAETVEYNTVSTPRGGQYQLVLSDGSKVWLNAESSITFPTAFVGKQRKVEIKGEAYFEIAHNPKMPFEVKVKNLNVQVLGTHFNVNAYDDETAVKTTLIEGLVKVSEGAFSKMLKPGQQAVAFSRGNKDIVVENVDVDEAVAWKNGFFHFNNSGLEEIMRQLSRWYDVEVVYNGVIPKRQFVGEMQRDLKLSQVLGLLAKNKVNFQIDGRKIIVQP